MKKELHQLKYVTAGTLKILFLQIIFATTMMANDSSAQVKSVKDVYVKIDLQDHSLLECLNAIEKRTDYSFSYDKNLIRNNSQKISYVSNNGSVESILLYMSEKYNIKFKQVNKVINVLENVSLEEPVEIVPINVQMKVSGTVMNERGEPLPGATIQEKGTVNGTITDSDGKFSLDVSGDATLIVTFIGYVNQEVTVNNRSQIDIQLSIDYDELDEVVVIGYGSIRKSDLTGSVSSVKGEDVNAFPTSSPLQSISGRAAGVQVLQNNGAPGGSISVRIRGTNSIRGNNEPLYVIDGFPISGSNPNIINNADIESIEVLKDASATAIYGSRGANGVVLITTKKGKSGETRVSYESTFSIQKLRKRLDLMNAEEYAIFHNEVAENDGLTQRFTQGEIDSQGEGFDWQNFVFRNALMQNHNLTVSGGTEDTQILSSLSILNQDGLIENSGHKRYSIRTFVNHDISKKLNINSNIILTKVIQSNQNSSGGNRGISLIGGSLHALPTVTPYNNDGSIRDLRVVYPWAIEIPNPAYYIDESSNVLRSNNILANVATTYSVLPNLSLKVNGAIEYSDDRRDLYQTSKYITSTSFASVGDSKLTSLLGEFSLNYTKVFGSHSLSTLIGSTYQDFLNTSMGVSGSGFLSDLFETYDIGAATTIGVPSTSYSMSVLLSGLARVNYNYSDKILATFSFRGDGSSKYTPGNKWGYFPSGAIAWRLSDENFLKNNTKISDLKFRMGWGITGSQAISAYSTLNTLFSGKTEMGDGLYTTFGPGSSLPGNLKWETTEQINFGVDAEFLNNRYRLTLDYYSKVTRDLLNPVPLAASTGYVNTIANVGSISNKGIELQLGADILTGVLRWSVDANISANRSKVIKLSEGEDILGSIYDVTLFRDNINILREGEAFGAFYGYLTDGYTDNGLLAYQDLNNDGSITIDDKVIIGDPNPDFYGGLNNTFTYKNLSLVIFLQGVFGNDIFNLSSVNNTLDVFFGGNMPKEVLTEHWSPENEDANYPLPSSRNEVRVSNRFVEDGSFLRLRNIQLSYNLPLDVSKSKFLKQLTLNLGGQNLITLSKYSWWDPEVNSSGGSNSFNQGIDFHTYPNYKSLIFGISAGF